MMTNTHIINSVAVLCERGFEAYYQELAHYFANNKRDNLTYGEFNNRTARATQPLKCVKEALFYTVAYAWPHYLTMRHQIESALKLKEGAKDVRLQVIDYGCGQGIATIALIESLVASGLPKESQIDLVLIEPSFVCLQIAQFLCARLANIHGINMIIQTQPCALKDARLPKMSPDGDTIHLMSNILDVREVQSNLESVVGDMSLIPGKHYLFAASPSYSDTEFGLKRFKQLMPYAEVWEETAITFSYDQYMIIQDRWSQRETTRSLLSLSWDSEDVAAKIAS